MHWLPRPDQRCSGTMTGSWWYICWSNSLPPSLLLHGICFRFSSGLSLYSIQKNRWRQGWMPLLMTYGLITVTQYVEFWNVSLLGTQYWFLSIDQQSIVSSLLCRYCAITDYTWQCRDVGSEGKHLFMNYASLILEVPSRVIILGQEREISQVFWTTAWIR